MDPFGNAKAFAELWAAGSKAAWSAADAAAKGSAAAMAASFGAGQAEPAQGAEIAAGIAELTAAGQAATQLWQAAVALAQSLPQRQGKGGEAERAVSALFARMTDPRAWFDVTADMDQVLTWMTEGPQLSDLWGTERQYARLARAWLAVRQRGLEHSTVVLGAWQDAARAFMQKLAAVDKPIPQDATLRLWIETANEVLVEMQRSERFLEAQARLIGASTELRLAQQELAEDLGARFGLPTRRELDDVHRTVTELRRELRAMRRAQRDSPREASAPRALPAPETAPPQGARPARATSRRARS
ncbi:poly(R)-hydroxyalkanoic acid synthase subunit PhaE [Falsiroseomonas sp. HW251]|uniref:poly(R)-hydroxyalkanoic acid synthase subunit PhaE n=1 Tax=Falsiroseomonas sp. HW251 TaxID=3390998 RepID=UPI003D31FBF3